MKGKRNYNWQQVFRDYISLYAERKGVDEEKLVYGKLAPEDEEGFIAAKKFVDQEIEGLLQ